MSETAYELIDRRYLGALRFVNGSTGRQINHRLKVDTDDLDFFRNRSGLWVISSAKGLESHLNQFRTPPLPPPDGDGPDFLSKTYPLEISDPTGQFLPRIVEIKLPRHLHRHQSENVFTPLDVSLYPSATISAATNWNVIRVAVQDASVLQQPADKAIAGAWLRIIKAGDSQPSAFGISDKRGEALVLLAGIPITAFSSDGEEPDDADDDEYNEWLATGPVVQQSMTFTVDVVVQPETPWPVDPQDLENHAADVDWRPAVQWRNGKSVQADPDAPIQNSPVELTLKPGEHQTLELYVTLPNTA